MMVKPLKKLRKKRKRAGGTKEKIKRTPLQLPELIQLIPQDKVAIDLIKSDRDTVKIMYYYYKNKSHYANKCLEPKNI